MLRFMGLQRVGHDFPNDFPGGSDGKVSVYNAGYPGSIPRWGRSPGEGNGNPLQYSCLEYQAIRGSLRGKGSLTQPGFGREGTQYFRAICEVKTAFCARAEGLLFLHGLESNPGSSLQTEEEAGLP